MNENVPVARFEERLVIVNVPLPIERLADQRCLSSYVGSYVTSAAITLVESITCGDGPTSALSTSRIVRDASDATHIVPSNTKYPSSTLLAFTYDAFHLSDSAVALIQDVFTTSGVSGGAAG
jgi:hypothetical protein